MIKMREKLKKWFTKKDNYLYFTLSIILTLLLLGGVVSLISGKNTMLHRIDRGSYGDGVETVDLIVEAELGGVTKSRKIKAAIEPRQLSDEEKKKRLEICKKNLNDIILGENESLKNITGDLELPTVHEPTGVRISWISSRPELIGNDGSVVPGQSSESAYVLLEAYLYLEGAEAEWRCNVKYAAFADAGNADKVIRSEIDRLAESLNQYGDSEYVILPEKSESGVRLKWNRPPNEKYILSALLVAAIMLFVRSWRRTGAKKRKRDRNEEIERDFPYFLDKLIMLLSAGLILSDAVERIAEDYKNYYMGNRKRVFYEELWVAVLAMRQSNSAFSDELMRLSERLDVREFARLSVILRNSLESGMDLVNKLEEESSLMWNERKNTVQKLGRLADTKLIFPLMVILIVLIVIVMMPAVMQM